MGWMVVTIPYTIPGRDEYMETFINNIHKNLLTRICETVRWPTSC